VSPALSLPLEKLVMSLSFGHFAEFTEVYQIEVDFAAKAEGEFKKLLEVVIKGSKN